MDQERMLIEQQLMMLIGQSRDVYYTEYLKELLAKVQSGSVTTVYAMQEINRTWALYQQRMQAQMQQYYAGGQPQQQVPYQPVQQPQTAQQLLQYQTVQPAQQPQVAQQSQQVQQPVQYQTVQPVQQPQVAQQPDSHAGKSVEFAIGAGVLSVVGVLFVLVAFVMLGMTYMSGMVKGMCLYVIAAVVLLVSELFLTRKMPRFAIGITGLGICGLHLSTLLNYLYLENFNGWVAAAVTVAVSVLAVLLGRKKDSGTLKIISFLGCYISIFMMGQSFFVWRFWGSRPDDGVVNARFAGTSVILLAVNLMTVFLPVKKYRNAVHITHLISNTVFTMLFALLSAFSVRFELILFFLLASLLVQGLVFYSLERPRILKQGAADSTTAGNITAYVATTMLLILQFIVTRHVTVQFIYESYFEESGWILHLMMGILFLICLFLFVLFRKSKLKWIQYWMFCFAAFSVYGLAEKKDSNFVLQTGVVLGIFILSKLLSRVRILRVSEMVITCVTAFEALFFFGQDDLTYAICFLGAFLLSMIALYEWKSAYEEIFILVFEAFVVMNFRNDLTIAIMTGILFLGILSFNSLDFFRGKHIKIWNYVNLGLMGCLYLAAAFYNNMISCILLLVLGCAFIILTFRDKFGMNFKWKHFILVIFLCYMTIIWEIPVPIYRSIILMVIAIGAVISGFALREKKLRVTGLVLTLTVCAKIALYDFRGAASVEKMILFLVVGLIALAISGIYIALEKKMV